MWVQLPLRDEAVAAKLSVLPQLSGLEPAAVQDLYFAPRVDLAFVAFLFPDWQSAEIHLIQEPDPGKRWNYFRRNFALANARRRTIATYLAKHVAHRTDCPAEELESVAGLVLSSLLSDENTGTPWESDSGVPPSVMWTPAPSGGAIPALLGLTGTGLLGEYQVVQPGTPGASPSQGTTTAATSGPAAAPGTVAPAPSLATAPAAGPSAASSAELGVPPSSSAATNFELVWRDVRGPLAAFGHERDHTNAPVPTVIPAVGLPASSSALVSLHNGYAVKAADGRRLGGAEGFRVRWCGVLLIEQEGEYAFHAGAPAPEGERPDFERASKSQWRLTLKRGSKTWVVLNHQWAGDPTPENSMPRLRGGAYQIVVEYNQPAPDFAGSQIHLQHSGFEVKYSGPDSGGCLVALPLKRLYRDFQNNTLDHGITFLPSSKNAQAFLKAFYTSTIRDMRRTYQRAFKALLFAGKLRLSAKRDHEDSQSELGYMLSNPPAFAGDAYYRTSASTTSSAFQQHLAYFNFNFLPLEDDYYQPAPPVPPAPPDRTAPSLERTQAMFDWWEQIFDYGRMREEVYRQHQLHLWRIFPAALAAAPGEAAQLLRYMGADPKDAMLDLHYYQDQSTAIYTLASANLQDDRWLVRAWRANQWVRRLIRHFHPQEMSKARPDLWAAQDPGAPMPASGTTQTGNANLQAFLVYGCLENGEPRRYQELGRLNDGLRERGRDALVSYLCANRVALPWNSTTTTYAASSGDLSALLLLDVEAGVCEKASRIEEAISAVQTFVRRSRLGLEPNWKVNREFVRLWESRFESFEVWERCKRREIYRENWIEWTELAKARRIDAFRFLESKLQAATLTLAAPGGLDWWVDDTESLERKPELIQRQVPSELQPLSAPPQSVSREGLGVLGRPEYAARPTWLAAVQQPSPSSAGSAPAAPTGASAPASAASALAGPAASSGATSSATAPTGSVASGPASGSATVPSLAHEAATTGSTQPGCPVPLWMESAMKMGTRFLRIAAAGVPQAALRFAPHGEERSEACCCECGQHHPVLIDEYYFWLINAQYYAYTDQTDATDPGGGSLGSGPSFTGSYQGGFQDSYYDSYQQQSAEWDDEDQVPALLAKWQPNPAVRLAWCRVHNGQFGQPRRSQDYVAIASPADLVFLGRGADSLYFEVSGSAPLAAGYGPEDGGDPSPPGFRYDLPTDEAVVVPQVLKPPAVTTSYPGGLFSYPFFAYHEPGACLFPGSWFSTSVVVAETLRTHCAFEPALKWYQRAFKPLESDCSWMKCESSRAGAGSGSGTIVRGSASAFSGPSAPTSGAATGGSAATAPASAETSAPSSPGPSASEVARGQGDNQTACCDSSKVTDQVARDRAVTLSYCKTLVDWGDRLMHRRRSPEAFQMARLMYDTAVKIMGPCPQTVLLAEPANPASVSAFVPAYPPLNPKLLDLYSLVADRLELIHLCIDARRLHNGRPGVDMPYFGDSPWREGWRTTFEPCAEEECCDRPSPYRFLFQIQKAIELAGRVRELGSALLSAYEKGDAECLASIRAGQERELLALGLTIRQDQWRDADWQIQALQQTKEVSQTNLIYYTNLYQNGLINDEIQNLSLATNALQTRTSANILEAFGEAMKIVPDFFVGALSTFSQIPIGTKLAGLFETIAKVMLTVADIQATTASLDLTQAGWDRRSDEWFHQMTILPIEIQQAELQILGAHRRRDQALQELNNQQRQIENATEVQDFLRDKFSATDLYLWLQKETAELHRRMYELAHCAALEAQRAYNFERGHTTRRFIPEDGWDTLHEGLMAGERLEFALRHMEKAYLDENVREYELTKHFSLRLDFPFEFLRLKAMGSCVIDLREWMFDLDYPGHYMRRIKNVNLTIPCVTGPYTGVHCKATLLSSMTRIDPRLDPSATGCCCECKPDEGYEACPHDPRIVRSYGAKEAIATSSGQNDTGLFELHADERYVPFEFHGAVGRWRHDLPFETNYIERESLTDLVMQVNYTSREGGEPLRRAASKAARKHLPGSGWCFFDIRHEFPDAWQLLLDSSQEQQCNPRIELRLERRMFPFVPGIEEISISKIAILFHARDNDECAESAASECACPEEEKAACHFLEFHQAHADRNRDGLQVPCRKSDEWPDLYYGIFDSQVGPVGRHDDRPRIGFRFPTGIGEIERIYLMCQYQANPCENTARPQEQRKNRCPSHKTVHGA